MAHYSYIIKCMTVAEIVLSYRKTVAYCLTKSLFENHNKLLRLTPCTFTCLAVPTAKANVNNPI